MNAAFFYASTTDVVIAQLDFCSPKAQRLVFSFNHPHLFVSAEKIAIQGIIANAVTEGHTSTAVCDPF